MLSRTRTTLVSLVAAFSVCCLTVPPTVAQASPKPKRTTTGEKHEYLKVELQQVIISSY